MDYLYQNKSELRNGTPTPIYVNIYLRIGLGVISCSHLCSLIITRSISDALNKKGQPRFKRNCPLKNC